MRQDTLDPPLLEGLLGLDYLFGRPHRPRPTRQPGTGAGQGLPTL